jgi:hypothetical protein
MKFKWNAKADTVSTMVLFLGSLIAALICIIWLAKNLSPDHITLQAMDNELTSMQGDLNKACRMETYWKNYYPKLNRGTLILNNLQVCVDSSECKVIFYQSNETEPIFENSTIILNNSYKCKNIESCKRFYYSSENNAEFETNKIIMVDASTCENKKEPIQRCRLLMCSLNYSNHIKLDDLTYINITKTNDKVFTFDPQ